MLANPPFNRSWADIGAMNDDQLFALTGHERNEDGSPKLKPAPLEIEGKSNFDHFKTFLFFQGVCDPATVRRLWDEKQKGHS